MKTEIEIQYANVGTVSHGTMRTEDLLESFSIELEWQIRKNGEFFSMPENFARRDKLNALVAEANDQWNDDGETLTDELNAQGLVDDLIDALQEFAPPYGYFGSHCGDGSDFGFWVDVDNAQDGVEFSSLREQEYPNDDFTGEWLHINERGNATLYYRAPGGKDREIWAVV